MKKLINIRVYTFCYNSSAILPFVIDYWKCYATSVVVFDNCSDDGSVSMLKQYPWIEVRRLDTKGTYDPQCIQKLKNECCKEEKAKEADYVMVCDIDEVLLFSDGIMRHLAEAKEKGVKFFKTHFYDVLSQQFPNYNGVLVQDLDFIKIVENKTHSSKAILYSPSVEITHTDMSMGYTTNDIIDNTDDIKVLHLKMFGLSNFKLTQTYMKLRLRKGLDAKQTLVYGSDVNTMIQIFNYRSADYYKEKLSVQKLLHNETNRQISTEDKKDIVIENNEPNWLTTKIQYSTERKNDRCVVAIPIYKSVLTANEIMSLKQVVNVLGDKNDIVLVCPNSLYYEYYNNTADYKFNILKCANRYFKNTATYSELCETSEFYECFKDYGYMLLYQLDGWIFKDVIRKFCILDYDYIGSPWRAGTFGFTLDAVGNGGVSFRKISKFIDICRRITPKEKASKYVNIEDLFFCKTMKSVCKDFNIAPLETAVMFCWDSEPEHWFNTNYGNLPMCAHGWESSLGFWNKHIRLAERVSSNVDTHKQTEEVIFACHQEEKTMEKSPNNQQENKTKVSRIKKRHHDEKINDIKVSLSELTESVSEAVEDISAIDVEIDNDSIDKTEYADLELQKLIEDTNGIDLMGIKNKINEIRINHHSEINDILYTDVEKHEDVEIDVHVRDIKHISRNNEGEDDGFAVDVHVYDSEVEHENIDVVNPIVIEPILVSKSTDIDDMKEEDAKPIEVTDFTDIQPIKLIDIEKVNVKSKDYTEKELDVKQSTDINVSSVSNVKNIVKKDDTKVNDIQWDIPEIQMPVSMSDNIEYGISICISAYKAKNFIRQTLDSIACQTWFKENDNWEVNIGIDGCVETLEYCKSIMPYYDENHFHFYMMEINMGTYVTSNTLMTKIARYSWLLRFDADDLMNKDMVEKLMSNTNKGYDVVRFKMHNFLDTTVKNIKSVPRDYVAFGQLFVKRNVFVKFGGFMPWQCHADNEFLLRIEKFSKVHVLNEVLFQRRIIENSLTRSSSTGYGSTMRSKYNHYVNHVTNRIKSEKDAIISCDTNIYTKLTSGLKVAICAIAKNENRYIREWVDYHINEIGFDKIFLYDNNDNDGERFEDVIGDYIEEGLVELIDVRGVQKGLVYDEHGLNLQPKCYIDCYKTYGSDFDFIAFIDVDEFVSFKHGLTLRKFLSHSSFKNYDTICVSWEHFDDNGHILYEDKPVMERFTHISQIDRHGLKSFVRTGRDIYMPNGIVLGKQIHYFRLEGLKAIYADGKTILDISGENWIQIAKHVHNSCNVVLNHYKTKSAEEYMSRQVGRFWGTSKAFTKKSLSVGDCIKDYFKYNMVTESKMKYFRSFS